jgi:hypothetical protein
MKDLRIEEIRFPYPDVPEVADVSFVFIENSATYIGGSVRFAITSAMTISDIKNETMSLFNHVMDIKE